MRLLVGWLLLAAPLVSAQTLTRAPAPLAPIVVPTPPELASGDESGTVVLAIDLGAEGQVLDVQVVTPSGLPALDRAAADAVKRSRFSPAELDGQRAAVRIQFTHTLKPRPKAEPPPMAAIRGRLTAAGTREPVAHALVVVGTFETVSDAQGDFVLEGVPPGPTRVRVSAPGFEPFDVEETLRPLERTEAAYVLAPSGELLGETVVRGERARREVSQVRLTQSEARVVAGARGDAFRVIQSLPGVARSPFGSGVLVVRGSKAWDSRIYVDDIAIPQLFHYGGLTATVNSETLSQVTFQPGNFGAEFGRAIGGLVHAETKTPSKTKLHGYVDANPFDVSALVEAPLAEAWSVSASARRGLADVTVPLGIKAFIPQSQQVVGFTLAPVSWDFQLKAERRLEGSKNRFFVSLLGSSDAWAFTQPNPFLDPESEGNQGTSGTTVLYQRAIAGLDLQLSERVTFSSRNSVGFDTYTVSGTSADVTFKGTQVPVQLREKLTFDVPEANLVFVAGLDFLAVPSFVEAQSPPQFKANQVPDPFIERQLLAEKSRTTWLEPAVFAEATWRPVESLVVTLGARADVEATQGHAWVDPRAAVRWTPWSPISLKGAVGVFHQPADYRQGQLSKVFGNPDLLPEGARHYAAGVEARLGERFELEVQGYYKDLFQQARQVLANGLGSDFNIPGSPSRYSSDGYGRAYGGEVLLRHKPKGRFFGWVSYALSRFERDYFGGVAYAPGPLDQPHNLTVVASYQLPWGLTVGARLRYASGPLVTPIVGSLYDGSGNYYYPLPGLPWSERLPDFFQLDLRIDKRFVFKRWSLSLYADVQNATNQRNAEGVFYNYDYTQKQIVGGIPILPAIGARGEF